MIFINKTYILKCSWQVSETLDSDPFFYIKLEEWRSPAFSSISFPLDSASRFPDAWPWLRKILMETMGRRQRVERDSRELK